MDVPLIGVLADIYLDMGDFQGEVFLSPPKGSLARWLDHPLAGYVSIRMARRLDERVNTVLMYATDPPLRMYGSSSDPRGIVSDVLDARYPFLSTKQKAWISLVVTLQGGRLLWRRSTTDKEMRNYIKEFLQTKEQQWKEDIIAPFITEANHRISEEIKELRS